MSDEPTTVYGTHTPSQGDMEPVGLAAVLVEAEPEDTVVAQVVTVRDDESQYDVFYYTGEDDPQHHSEIVSTIPLTPRRLQDIEGEIEAYEMVSYEDGIQNR